MSSSNVSLQTIQRTRTGSTVDRQTSAEGDFQSGASFRRISSASTTRTAQYPPSIVSRVVGDDDVREEVFIADQANEGTGDLTAVSSAGEYLDGGYGWVVTGGAFTLLFLQLGTLYAWGVLQAELANQRLGSSVVLSSIGGISGFFTAMGCLPGSWVVSKLGPRIAGLISVFTAATSLIISSFLTRHVAGLIIFHGVVFGSSSGLGYMSAYTIPSQYFLKKRGLSTGIASCGAGIGGAAMAVISQKTIEAWGLPWTFRFLALLSLLLGIPASLVLKTGYIAPRSATATVTGEKGMFKSSRYIRLLIACFVASYPFFIPPYYIPQYAQSVGLSASQGALYSALFNITSGIGRIAFGLLADSLLGNLNSWTLALVTIALSSLLVWPNATGQTMIIVFVVFCGLGSGGFFTLQSSIVGQIIGSHRVSIGVAWLEVAMSFGNIAGPISAGALLDAFGGPDKGAGPYKPAIYLVGATTAASALLVASIRFSTSRSIWGRV